MHRTLATVLATTVVLLGAVAGASGLGVGPPLTPSPHDAPTDASPHQDPPPVTWAPGADAQPPDGKIVRAFILTDDAAAFHADLAGIPGATVTVGSLATLANEAPDERRVQLRAPAVQNPAVEAYRFTLQSPAGDTAGTIDLLDPTPQVTLELDPGQRLTLAATIALAEGTTPSQLAGLEVGIRASVTPP